MDQSKTIEELKHSDAMLEGHFLLSSGLHSDKYFQCARLLQYPDRAATALSDLVSRLQDAINEGSLKIDAICGPAMGGIIVAWELARQLGVPAFFTERDDSGAMSLRRGFQVEQGQHILIAEDVVTTGKSSVETAKILEAAGATVCALACVVDRRAPDMGVQWPLYAAAKVSVETWPAENCELCNQGSTAVKPGSRRVF